MIQEMVRRNAEARAPWFARVNTGWAAAATRLHARLWLTADGSEDGQRWSEAAMAAALDTREAPVHRGRRALVAGGLETAVSRQPPPGRQERTRDGPQDAHLRAVPGRAPPAGRRRWTLTVAADTRVALDLVDRRRPEGVRPTRKTTRSPRGRTSAG